MWPSLKTANRTILNFSILLWGRQKWSPLKKKCCPEGLSYLGSFIRSNMYLVSYRGSTQLRDSESESLVLTSSYVTFFPRILKFSPATQKNNHQGKLTPWLLCKWEMSQSRVLHENIVDFSNDSLNTKLSGNIFSL